MVPHATQPKLARNVDVSLSILCSVFVNVFSGILILLPNGTAVYAFNRPRLALRPLVKASLVDIVPACSFAPQNFIAGLEFYDTHWTIALDRLSLSGM